MKLQLLAAVVSTALGAGIIGGCATNRPSDMTFEVGNHPQMLMPGAARSDVKGLAMGAARTKGWRIVRSTDDLLVVERRLDPTSPAAQTLGAAGSTIPPVVQVTSAFVEQTNGVNVALGAELVSQPPGEKAPKRTDITDAYRHELQESLESLRANWSANRERVAKAIPPVMTESERIAQGAPDTAAGKASDNPLVRTWAEALDEQKAASGGATPGSAVAPPEETASSEPPPRTPAAPPPEPQVAAARTTPPLAPEPAREPMRTPDPAPVEHAAASPQVGSAGGAPVVDGSQAMASDRTAWGGQSSMLPPARTELPSPRDNMLSLSQATGTGTWAYYAEQYARLRGCNVTEQGSILIDNQADGEVLKVPCAGTDSILVKCRDGVCRGLQ